MIPYAFLYLFILSAMVATQALPYQSLVDEKQTPSSLVKDKRDAETFDANDESFRPHDESASNPTDSQKEPKGIPDRLTINGLPPFRTTALAARRAQVMDPQTSIVAVKVKNNEEPYKNQLSGEFPAAEGLEEDMSELLPRETNHFGPTKSKKIEQKARLIDTRSWIAGRNVENEASIGIRYRELGDETTNIDVLKKSCPSCILEKGRTPVTTLPSYSTRGIMDTIKGTFSAVPTKTVEMYSAANFVDLASSADTMTAFPTSGVVDSNSTVIWTDKVIQASFEKMFVVFCIGIGIALVIFLCIGFIRKNPVLRNIFLIITLAWRARRFEKDMEEVASTEPTIPDQIDPNVLEQNATLPPQETPEVNEAHKTEEVSQETWYGRLFRRERSREEEPTRPTPESDVYRNLPEFLRRPNMTSTATNKNPDPGLLLNLVNERLCGASQNMPTNIDEDCWASGLQETEGRETLRDRRTGLRNSWLSSLFVNKVPGTENLVIIDDGQGVLHGASQGTTGRQPDILEVSSAGISAETMKTHTTSAERNMSLKTREKNLNEKLRAENNSPRIEKCSLGDQSAKENIGKPSETDDSTLHGGLFRSSHSPKSSIRTKSARRYRNIVEWNSGMSDYLANYQDTDGMPSLSRPAPMEIVGKAVESDDKVTKHDAVQVESPISTTNATENTFFESDAKKIKSVVLENNGDIPKINLDECPPTSIQSKRNDNIFSHHTSSSLYSNGTITSDPTIQSGIKSGILDEAASDETEGIVKPAVVDISNPQTDSDEDFIMNSYLQDLDRTCTE
ncbi:hypothetical protein EDC01DRAFT_626524 [Geopyxis carbonaria]|nr:hypothetical protein EDC01DRAFT_626524 [Geopyxis carbonaria]